MERACVARRETMEPRELPAVVALAATSATVALAFGRVFEPSRYLAPVLVAVLLPHLIGVLCRWRRLGDAITWSALAGGLAVYVLVLAGSPGALVEHLRGGWQVVGHDAVPIRATDGAVLLTVVIVWFVAALADDLAFRRRASLGALAPG